MWGDGVPPGEDPSLECCRPLKVEVLKPDAEALRFWAAPEFTTYKGNHGLQAKSWE